MPDVIPCKLSEAPGSPTSPSGIKKEGAIELTLWEGAGRRSGEGEMQAWEGQNLWRCCRPTECAEMSWQSVWDPGAGAWHAVVRSLELMPWALGQEEVTEGL